jgi:multidrug resistance efflux pump
MSFSTDPIHNIENLHARYKVKSWSIYLVVLLAIIIFLVSLPVIKVNISSQSRGIIRSVKDNVPISSLVSGRISKINLRNNLSVKKGDTLVVISRENLVMEKEVNINLANNHTQVLQDIQKVLQGQTNQITSPMVREELYRYQSQRNELKSKVTQAQNYYDRNKTLFDKGVIAKVEFEKYSFELDFAKKVLQSFEKQQYANWQNQKNELSLTVQNYQGTNQKIEVQEKNYTILAPCNGTIERFIGLQNSSYSNAGQEIASISPQDDLIVESMVMPKDIGLIKIGQETKFQLDAFNYNQWGLLTGKVIDIDHNISQQNNQVFFKVRCKLNQKKLSLKSGYETQVSKGMTLTTRYNITNRSLFDLLFDKMDNWLNPKQMNTELEK